MLIEQIGEGGMGTVYLAEQREPIRRRVALKIIKPGMDSQQVVARFKAERQALAMMDHPNIAKVFVSGNTVNNRPYFVMELVRGVPITAYCDRHKLSIRERLDLFITVCQAVQHAHQKGIIHRDLKPTNILVELHDVVSVPKVIDFGIAKATEGQLSESTLVTGFAQLVDTLMYMSPEQLWERLRQLNYDDMRRILREEEPPRPGQRLSTLAAEARSTVSEQRKLDKRQMSHHLRGELDWIVVRALENDRSRRYGSAADLAEDIGRYLRNEPVEAGPPSAAYRLKKYAQRNRVALLTSITVGMALLLLLVGACVYSLELRDHNRELAQALSRAESSERHERLENYAGQIRLAEGLRENRQFAIMQVTLAAQQPSAPAGDLRGFEWRFLWAEAIREPRRLATHHPTWAEVEFSADEAAAYAGSPVESLLKANITVADTDFNLFYGLHLDGAGIFVESSVTDASTNNRFQNLQFRNSSYGISIHSGTQNQIVNSSFLNGVYGIYVSGSGQATVTGSNFSGLSRGIYSESGVNLVIDSNTISGTYGSQLSNGSATISNNTIFGGVYGIRSDYATAFALQNDVHDNQTGIFSY